MNDLSCDLNKYRQRRSIRFRLWCFHLTFLVSVVSAGVPSTASGQDIRKVIDNAREDKNFDVSTLLRELEPADEQTKATLRAALLASDPFVRKTAAAMLGHLRDPSPKLMSRLLYDTSVEVREAAEQALISMGTLALGELGGVLAQGRGDVDAYGRAVRAIGKIGAVEGVPLLCEALNKDPTCAFRHDGEVLALVESGAPALKCPFPSCMESDYTFAFALIDPQKSMEVCREIIAQHNAPEKVVQRAAGRLRTLQAEPGTYHVFILSRGASSPLRWGLSHKEATRFGEDRPRQLGLLHQEGVRG